MNAEILALLGRCFPHNKASAYTQRNMTILRVSNGHLPCLLPQVGPGKKHERGIVLEPWQQDLVAAAPWAFLRGLVRSDGCYYLNRFKGYALPSYAFHNRSVDILALFASTCDRVDVEYRTYDHEIRIYRRESVALFEEHVGAKR